MRRSFFSLVFTSFSLVLAGCSGGGDGPKTTTPPPISPANNPVPTVNAISPTNVPAGSPALTVTFTGTGYIKATTATLNGVAVQANYVSATSLQASVPATALAAGQVADFVLSNPSPGGGSSITAKFSIMSPTPVVNGVSPRNIPQGADAMITVSGSGFEANSVVLYNGSARPTTFVNSTTLQVALTANDVKSFGTGEISVYNPGPGRKYLDSHRAGNCCFGAHDHICQPFFLRSKCHNKCTCFDLHQRKRICAERYRAGKRNSASHQFAKWDQHLGLSGAFFLCRSRLDPGRGEQSWLSGGAVERGDDYRCGAYRDAFALT